MDLIRLTAEYELKPFDCGDTDLNGFLMNDAKRFAETKIANTFLLEEDGRIIAYFCLLNDKVSKQDMTNGTWRKVKKKFPHEKHFSSYPSIKIGRFAVSLNYKGQGIGCKIMLFLKYMLHEENAYSAFRFLTVDAYLSAIPFYIKNDFELLIPDDDNEHTRMMYFDMIYLSSMKGT